MSSVLFFTVFFEGERHDLSKTGGFGRKMPPPPGKPVTFYECHPDDHAPAPSVRADFVRNPVVDFSCRFVGNWCYSWETSCAPNSAQILVVAAKHPVSALSLLSSLHFDYSNLPKNVSHSPQIPLGPRLNNVGWRTTKNRYSDECGKLCRPKR